MFRIYEYLKKKLNIKLCINTVNVSAGILALFMSLGLGPAVAATDTAKNATEILNLAKKEFYQEKAKQPVFRFTFGFF